MLAYHVINIQKNKDIETDNDSSNKMSHTLLEKVVKIVKKHRNVTDSDCKWIADVVGNIQNSIDIDR